MGVFKKLFGGAIFKISVINTFNSFSPSTDDKQYKKQCEFLHKRYEDGKHEIEVKISEGNPMKFSLLSEPISMGKGILMYELGSINGDIVGIDLMMMGASAYIKYPDGTMIIFRK